MKQTFGMIKSPDALAAIREGGRLLGIILEDVAAAVKPGVTTQALDDMARAAIEAVGGRPSFLGYKISPRIGAYPASLCVSVNDEVVHGIPQATHVLAEGDIVGLDIGMEWPYQKGATGFYTDTAVSVGVGTISKEDADLLARTYASLMAGIAAARAGRMVQDISRAIETSLKVFPYGIVKDLVGHGVGYAVHEEPQVPNFVDARARPVPLVPGMVIALEPMVTRGTDAVTTDADGWTIRTRDKSHAGHFEHTIIITDAEPAIVTHRPHEA